MKEDEEVRHLKLDRSTTYQEGLLCYSLQEYLLAALEKGIYGLQRQNIPLITKVGMSYQPLHFQKNTTREQTDNKMI